MRSVIFILTICLSGLGHAQKVQVFQTFEDFKPLLEKSDDKIHVLNFWATWCKPCIAELPYFEALNKKYQGKKVEFTLVSLDFGTQLESQVIPFLEKRNIKSKVVLLDDPKSMVWIDLVDKSWSGAIPATMVYKGNESNFYEKEFHSEAELEDIISQFFK